MSLATYKVGADVGGGDGIMGILEVPARPTGQIPESSVGPLAGSSAASEELA